MKKANIILQASILLQEKYRMLLFAAEDDCIIVVGSNPILSAIICPGDSTQAIWDYEFLANNSTEAETLVIELATEASNIFPNNCF